MSNTKTCTKCQQDLPLDCFYTQKYGRLGVRAKCKKCMNKESSAYALTPAGKASNRKHWLSEKFRVNQNAYYQTPKGKAIKKECDRKYSQSPEGKISKKKARQRYIQTDKYKQTMLRLSRAYRLTPKGQESIKAAYKKWSQSEKGKAKLKELRLKYHDREWYKKMIKTSLAKYMKSDKRKAVKSRNESKRRAQRRAGKLIVPTLTAEEWNVIKKRYKNRCVYCGQEKPLTRDHIIPLSKGGYHTKDNIVPACLSCNSRKMDKPVLLQLLAI